MTDHLFSDESFRIRAGRVIGVLSIMLGLYPLIVLPTAGLAQVLVEDFIPHGVILAVGFGVFALIAVPRQPFNSSVWVAVWGGLISGISMAGYSSSYVVLANTFGTDLDALGQLAPADVPTLAAILYMFIGGVGISFLLIVGVGLVLFPEGELPSPRWRPVLWGSAIPAVGFLIAIAHEFRPGSSTPYGAGSARWTGGGRYIEVIMLVWIIFLAASLVSAVGRFRRSEGAARQQYKWIGLGCGMFVAALLVVGLTGGGFVADLGEYPVKWLAALVGIAGILAGYAIAIGKYRLFDVDVVISRTLVYGTLAVFIGAVYVGIAVLPWVVLGSEAENHTWLGIIATIVVAVSFQPLRRRLERLANRIVYGRRATPYEVLSTFAQGVSAVDPRVLTHVAKSLAEGTTAHAASIWIDRAGSPQCIAAWPEMPDSVHKGDVTAAVVHDEEELGRVALEIPPGQPFPEPDRRLLDQVAAGLGLALRNMQLTEDLKERVDELAASRRRIVTVQDETRRKLERDLHDGAQQRLVALKIKLGIGSALAGKAGLADVRAVIDTVRSETDQTIDSVRDFARGIYPPLLETEGLGQALNAQARRMHIPVTVQAAGLGRYPKEQEATVYFCVLEALQNAMKHSEASSVRVVLSESGGELSFLVSDDGVGFDKAAVDPNGLLNMKDRVEAVGGR